MPKFLKVAVVILALAAAGALFAKAGLTYADLPPCGPPFNCLN